MSKKENLIHVTTNHTSKMENMVSISTSCLYNVNCEKYRSIDGSICQNCYATSMLEYRLNTNKCFVHNSEILSAQVLSVDELPTFNNLFVRLESFGDLINETHFINYLNICIKNPYVNFAIWTKNPNIMASVFESGYTKPKNLNIIVSSLFVNKAANVTAYPFVDIVFTVFSLDYAIEHNIKINCGVKKCFECQKCYKSMKAGHKVIYVNELLKNEQVKAKKLGIKINYAFN